MEPRPKISRPITSTSTAQLLRVASVFSLKSNRTGPFPLFGSAKGRPVTVGMALRRRFPLLVLLLLLSPPAPAEGLRLGQLGTLLSLSRSLLSRVANAREARGDLAGAARARSIAGKLSLVSGDGGGGIWSLGWDFAWNYAWRGLPAAGISRAASELLAAVSEAARIESHEKRVRWVIRQYPRILALANALLQNLREAFDRTGPLREMVLVLQREAAEGELLKDCLEVAAGDLEGLLRVARDFFFSSDYNSSDGEL